MGSGKPRDRSRPRAFRVIAALLQGLRIQQRVLYALLMRELITRFGRENLGVLWLVGEPMLFTLGVTTLWTAAGLHRGTGIPIVAFAVTGYSSVLMWRNSASRAGGAIAQNKSLLFHRNVKIIDVLLTRIVLEVGGATASFIVLSVFFIYIGWMPAPVDLLEVVFGWVMLAWFGASLALLIGAGTAFSEIVERLWHPAAYLLFPLSGAAFMVDWLPVNMQKVALMLPMVHGTEILREGYFGNVVPTHYDVGYMAMCCLLLSFAALYIVREASRRVEF
jgi:capsular polysaccharide transport system permease protein